MSSVINKDFLWQFKKKSSNFYKFNSSPTKQNIIILKRTNRKDLYIDFFIYIS